MLKTISDKFEKIEEINREIYKIQSLCPHTNKFANLYIQCADCGEILNSWK